MRRVICYIQSSKKEIIGFRWDGVKKLGRTALEPFCHGAADVFYFLITCER